MGTMHYVLMVFFKCNNESVETKARWICKAINLSYDEENPARFHKDNNDGEYSFKFNTLKDMQNASKNINKLSLKDVSFVTAKLYKNGSWKSVTM